MLSTKVPCLASVRKKNGERVNIGINFWKPVVPVLFVVREQGCLDCQAGVASLSLSLSLLWPSVVLFRNSTCIHLQSLLAYVICGSGNLSSSSLSAFKSVLKL